VSKRDRIGQLERQLSEPGVWDDSERAQELTKDLSSVKNEVETWESLSSHARELEGLLDLAAEDGDSDMIEGVELETGDLAQQFERLEMKLIMSGDHDQRGAILAIHAGAGGTDSQDWAEMLLRMYIRWAERSGYQANILDLSPGEEAGIKSVTVEIKGDYAYGHLKSERGAHRLVRLSPFDAAHRRHTSFSLVEVMPEVGDSVEVRINPDDLRTDYYRAGGAGGQHVNKTSSAVRITHVPTGIVASCQNERSQAQNRAVAMRILRARLLELELLKQQEEQARLKGEHVDGSWGNQIRSYVLHPYHQVKDLRSGVEKGDVDAVLDGDIDPFIEAYLRLDIGESNE
jgi:peptide chain release factor 2